MDSTKLRPILGDIVEVRRYDGRYRVQLEIPSGSTLTPNEIGRILKISSWSTNPAAVSEGYEGARSILLRRERSITRGGVELAGLQISGIGWKEIDFSGKLGYYRDNFYPPSNANFMDSVPGTLMSTSQANGSAILTSRPTYRAKGTYIASELEEKVRKTDEVSRREFKNFAVPNVEAYGRYLEPELGNQEGQFGFFIFPVPDPAKQRAGNEALDNFKSLLRGDPSLHPTVAFYNSFSPYLVAFSCALGELHDNHRMVHLQTHLGNFYLVRGKPYIVDWPTMHRLGENGGENILNRTIDLKRPADDYEKLLKNTFEKIPEGIRLRQLFAARALCMESYSGNSSREIDFLSVGKYHVNIIGRDITEFETISMWMKAEGKEGYTPQPDQYKRVSNVSQPPIPQIITTIQRQGQRKIGRNEPCPCGSGKKYKRCCASKDNTLRFLL
jgi:hypothetical protein